MGLPAATAGKLPTGSCRGVMEVPRRSTKVGYRKVGLMKDVHSRA